MNEMSSKSDKGLSAFGSQCYLEENLNAPEKADKNTCDELTSDEQKNLHPESHKSRNKNFIHRNIELAATAMYKLSLTDEEKQKLESLLSDIDCQQDCKADSAVAATDSKETDDEDVLNETEDLRNAFHLCEDDQKRISEINFQLENNYEETQHLRPQTNDLDSFWKSLVLEQMLKDIDNKLAVIKEEDDVKISE